MSARKKPKKPTYVQDEFDKGLIKVLHELQLVGYCKNINSLEIHLGIPVGTIYQVKSGLRGVPKLKRDKIMKHFVNVYGVNAYIFTSHKAKVFKGEGPTIAENAETYIDKKESNQITTGDLLKIEAIKNENATMKARISDLEQLIKSQTSELASLKRMISILEKGAR